MPLNHAPGNAAPAMTRILQGVNVDTFLLAFNYDLNHRDGLDEAIPLADQRVSVILIGASTPAETEAAPRSWRGRHMGSVLSLSPDRP